MRVTRSKTTSKHEDTKENQSVNKIVEDPLKTPRKRTNKAAEAKHESESPPKIRKEDTVKTSPGISDRFRSSLTLENDLTSPRARSKYSSARRALTANLSHTLPGREAEIERLKDFIDTAVDEKQGCSLYISGQPGTGKTACLMKLMNTKEYQKRIEMAYVNCTSISSIGSIYKRIAATLELPCRGSTEKDFCTAVENYLTTTSTKKMVMIVLDEIDQLADSKKQTVLYRIFEWPSWSDSRLILVGIANSLDLTDRLLVRLQTKCELQPTLMHFEPYTKPQIVEIFKNRLAEANVLELFPVTTLQLLAAKVAAVSGDIRRALDIGRRVIAMAQHGEDVRNIQNEVLQENAAATDTPVQIKAVLSVMNSVYGNVETLKEESDAIPLQQKLLICALLLIIKNDKNKDVTVGRLHEVYKKVCKKRNLMALDFSEFINICELVEVRGMIRLNKKKEARFSRIFMQWDEDEVSTTLRDKGLMVAILEDKSCLAR